MPTPNSPGHEPVDIHADPAFQQEFGTNVGEKVLEKASAREWVDVPVRRSRICNVGRLDQRLRVGGGAALLAAAAFAPLGRNWRMALAGLGIAEIVTGAMRYCPLWHALGVNTNRERTS